MWALVALILLTSVGIYVYRMNSRGSAEPSKTAPSTTAPPATSTAKADGTQILDVSPLNSDGSVKPEFTVSSSETQVEGCVASRSAVSPGVVGCSPTAANAGVCWVTPNQSTLLCGELPLGPRTRPGNVQRTGGGHGRTTVDPRTVGLELETGERCALRDGGSWPNRDDDYNGAYWCEDSDEVILAHVDSEDYIDRTSDSWRVFVGSPDGAATPRSVQVLVA
jgi:hypothetical protein